jgi:hypothetical protein
MVDICEPNAQEWVQQWDFHTAPQAKWTVQKQSDGFYTIRSEYGSKLYVGVSDINIGVDNIKLYASISDATRWSVYQNAAGELVFDPKIAPGRLLYAPNASTGTQLRLAFGNVIGSYSLWKIAPIDTFSINGGLETRSVTLRCVGAITRNTTWLPIINAAAGAWNSSGAGTGISITETGSSLHTIEVISDDGSWDGQCIKNPDGNVIATSSTIQINITGNSELGEISVFRQATVIHEMGHLFWLGDNPQQIASQKSIMWYADVYSNGISLPQPFDVNNVLFYYN